ncbi:MAG: helix-turn-helix domain-containing protein [Bacteroidota bacterium]
MQKLVEQQGEFQQLKKLLQSELEQLKKLLQMAVLSQKETLTFSETAIYTGLSESHLYRLTSKKIIPHYKQGKPLYFKRTEVDAWLTAHPVKTRPEIEREAVERLCQLRKTA